MRVRTTARRAAHGSGWRIGLMMLATAGCGGSDSPGLECVQTADCPPTMICLDQRCEMPADIGGDASVVDGCVVSEEVCDGVDNDCDGSVDERLRLCDRCETDCFVEGYPGPCSTAVDVGLDGSIEQTSTHFYEGVREVSREDDRDNDGAHDFRVQWLYNGEGDRIGEAHFDGDNMPIGSALRTVEDGRLLQIDYDRDNDGEVDGINYYRYEGDVQVGLDIDSDADGTIDSEFENFYDESGFRTHRERTRNGVVDQRVEFANDARGNLLEIRTDYTNDGSFDQLQTFDYRCWESSS